MATPILDSAILKLRRKLGDIYDELGKEIVTSTTPSSNQIWVGNTSLRSTWSSTELIDIWNDSVYEFISYCVKFIPLERVWEFIPGFIVYKSVTVSPLTIGNNVVHYVDLDAVSPVADYVLDVRDSGWFSGVPTGDTQRKLGVPISPTQFFSSLINTRSSTYSQLLYTICSLNTTTQRMLVLFNMVSSPTTVELVYLKKYTRLGHSSTTGTDISGFTEIGMKRIQTLAEVYAQRYRSQEVRDLSDLEKKEIIESDVLLRRQ